MKEDAYMNGLLSAHLAECESAQTRQEWIDERVDKLIYDGDWLDGLLDAYASDKDHWREVVLLLNQLPILLIHNLSKLAPTWRQTCEEHKEVDQILEIADTLLDLIKVKASHDAERDYEKMIEESERACTEYSASNRDDELHGAYPCHY